MATTNMYHPIPVHGNYEPRLAFTTFPQISNDRHYQPDSTPPPPPAHHSSPLMMPHQQYQHPHHLSHTPRSVSLGSIHLAGEAGIQLNNAGGADNDSFDFAEVGVQQHHSSPRPFDQSHSQYSGSAYSTPVPAHQTIRQAPATWPTVPSLTRTFSDSYVPVLMPSFDTVAPQNMPLFAPAQRYVNAFSTPNGYVYQQPEALHPGAELMDGKGTTPLKSKKHVCVVCDKRFSRPSSLTTHMSVHTGAKPFTCQHQGCGRRFSVGSNLRRHLKTHDDATSLQSSSTSSAKSSSSSSRAYSQTPYFHPYHQPAEEMQAPAAHGYASLPFSLSPESGPGIDFSHYQLPEHQSHGEQLAQLAAAAQPGFESIMSSNMQRQNSSESGSHGAISHEDGLLDAAQPTTPGTPPHLALPYDTTFEHDSHGK